MRKRTRFDAALIACLALLIGGCSAVTDKPAVDPGAGKSAQEDVKPLGFVQDEAPMGQEQSEEERRRLADQAKQVLIANYVADAKNLIQQGALNRAESLLFQAIRTAPDSAEARSLLADVQRRLGKRVGEIGSLAEQEEIKRKLRNEAAYAKVVNSLRRGDDLMAGGDYREAARQYQTAAMLLRYNPLLGEQEPNLRSTAESKLNDARLASRSQDKAAREEAAQAAYDRLRAEDEAEANRRRARTKRVLDKAQMRFEENRFNEAERLVDNVLENDPTNLEARKLRDTIQDARHNYLDDKYLEESKERFKIWREAIAATKIPESDVIVWPTQTHWDKITRGRAQYSPVYGTEDSPTVKKLKNKLATEEIPLQFDSAANLKEVLDWVRNVANIPIVIDAEIKEDLTSADLGFPLKLDKVKVGTALDTVIGAKPEFGYTFKHDVIYVTKKEKASGSPIPIVHDVRDLTIPVQDFSPPEIRLKAAGGDEEGGSIFGAPSGEAAPTYQPEDLIELIKANVVTKSWDERDDLSIDLQNGRLLVVHNAEAQNEISRFLNDLRSFSTSIVTVEARFITVNDNFLQDIGVDWRGLGGAGQSGTLAVLDDVTNGAVNMASAGLDNGGTGLPINNIQSPTSGAFFNDGEDGDYRARTENIFDRVVGNMLSSVGGLSLSFAYLDDAELGLVLRAVEKSERATLMTAPRLTVYNTQRSNITLVNQISYIKDYDVEVAQTASIADPVVGIIQDGLVLDVRPTISNDRKFVTLELRPTVANLIEPIRTITTTLGSQTQPVTIQLPELIVQSAETTVTVPDRGSVVIGGLKNILSIDRRSEIPFLADIPILGFLFSRKAKSEEAQDLILVVSVEISDMEEQEAQLRR